MSSIEREIDRGREREREGERQRQRVKVTDANKVNFSHLWIAYTAGGQYDTHAPISSRTHHLYLET